MKRAVLAILLPTLMVPCGAAFGAYPMRMRDARGKTVTLRAKPVRVVALTPNITEILFAVGLNDRIVGVNSRSDYPAQAMSKPKVGDVTISAESVVALKPDLVLAHAYLNRSAILRLEKLGLTVFALDPKTINGVIADIRTVGRLTARPLTAENLALKMERQIAAQKASGKKRSSREVLVVIQANPLWVAGPTTFVNEMLGIANARNVARDARPGFVTFSKELAIRRNPDLIIVGTRSDMVHFVKSPEWRNTKAVKCGRVCVINNDLLVRPGPRLVDGLKALASELAK